MPDHSPADWHTAAIVAPPRGSACDVLGWIPWLRRVSGHTLNRLAEQAVLHRIPSGGILFEQS